MFNPYALYATDITQFDSTQTLSTLGALFGAFLITSFIAIYATSFIPKKFAKIPAFAFSLALFIGLIYSFILVGDYGAMDHFILQKPPFLYHETRSNVRELIALLTLGIVVVLVAFKWLIYAWRVVLATMIIVSGINVAQIALQRLDSANFAESSIKSPPPSRLTAPYSNELFSYSKTQKNIIVIVLDMFSGSHTPHILAQFPHLKTALDGFILFPNALSTTDSTIHSVATLIGGEYYAVYNMNARGVNLKSEIESAFKSTTSAFANSNFEVALIAYTGSKIQNLTAPNIFALDSASEVFVPYYGAELGLTKRIHRAKSINNRNIIGQLIAFGIFKVAPTVFKMGIYNDGNWLFSADWYLEKILNSIKQSADFYALTHNVSVDSTKPTFKFIHTMMTHLPFGAHFKDGKCEFGGKFSAWSEYPHKVQMRYPSFWRQLNFYQHYDLEACALHYLADFVENLKRVGVYDNTQILVVSDHAGNDGINMPILDENDFRPDALFLFKDFGAKGAIRVDKRLMANYDIASIFCENLPSGCLNVGKNILQNYPKKREIIHTIPLHWRLEAHKPNEWLIRKAFKVKGDIYNAKNWREFDEIVNVRE